MSYTKWAGRLGLAAGSTLLALFVLELGLRLKQPAGWEFMVGQSPDINLFEADPELDHRLIPNTQVVISTPEHKATVRINSLGMRGAELLPKQAGSYRILTLGDSFTLGTQVEEAETFQHHLAQDLSTRLKRAVEVLNGGIDDVSTYEEVYWGRRLDPIVEPDALLMVFFLGNDLGDNLDFSARRHRPNVHKNELKPTILSSLSKRIFTLYYLSVLTTPVPEHHRQELEIYVSQPKLQNLLEPSRKALLEYQELCLSASLDCFLAIAPPTYLANVERAPATFKRVGFEEGVDLDSVPSAVMSIVPPEVHALSLIPALREAASERAVYFKYDDHWTAAGHEVVAGALAPFIEEQLK